MLLSLILKMEELRLDAPQFFRIAHVWAFGRDVYPHGDIEAFQKYGVIPAYVARYLSHIREGEQK